MSSNLSEPKSVVDKPASSQALKDLKTIALAETILCSRLFTTNHRVIYANTDKMGVVYHANYLEFFEIGRNELLREAGFSYKRLEANGIFLPIIESNLKYHRPAQYDDLLTIKTQVTKNPNKPLRYKIFCWVYNNDVLLTEGFTLHVVSNNQGRPFKPDKAISEELNQRLFAL
jgi:acyl-CoA thioester hydrolase